MAKNFPHTTSLYLLKYLQFKALELDSFEIPNESLADLPAIQRTCGSEVYHKHMVHADLKRLEQRGFLRVSPNPGIVISQLGLYFAEGFDAPPGLEDYFAAKRR